MRKKKSIIPVVIMALIMIIIVVIGGIMLQNSGSGKEMNKSEYYGISEGEVPLIVNDTILEERGVLIDGSVFVDYSTAWNYLNPGFYWSEEKGALLLALQNETRSWQPDDASGAVTRDEEGNLLLSAEMIINNSDIDCTVYEEPARLVARTRWGGLKTCSVSETVNVRYKAGKRSEILTVVEAGDPIVMLDNSETTEGWQKVSTPDGYIGYLSENLIQEDTEESAITHMSGEEYMYTHVLREKQIAMAWHYVDCQENNAMLTELTEKASSLNVVSPTWYSLADASGNLNSLADATYVETAHNAGMEVWPLLGDTLGAETKPEDVLENEAARSKMIDQLLAQADQFGFDGINVDFESISEETAPAYLHFLKELCIRAHEKGLVISTDNYVPTYTQQYKRGEQSKTVDYIVIMGYDEHNTDSQEAGSVASISFVEQGIVDTLVDIASGQVINAVPFYTRGWTTPFGKDVLYSEALSMPAAQEFAEKYGIKLSWNEETGQNIGSADDETNRYSIWMEDADSMKLRLEMMKQYDLAGVAAWRLGLETDDVWPLIGEYLSASENQ